MKLNTKLLGVWAAAAALCLCAGNLPAQDEGGGPGGGGPGGQADFGGPGGPGGFGGPGGGFDPAQFQQRIMDQYRQRLSVTNDDEWALIQPLIQKVMDARRQAGNGGGPGGPGGPGGFGGRGGPGGPGGFEGQAGDEQLALQQAVSNNSPVPQIKDALVKFRAARKARQALLEAAQDNLRAVLTVKQEAQAVLMGILS